MWWWRGGLVAALVVALAACSTTRPVTPPIVEGRQEGVASWYGPGFHGKRTANGEIYDQYELTAAHQTLPLGTRVMVTSLANGRSVEVRINDRGPFVGGRIVDLSYAAASVLRMVGPGTMPVRLEILDAPVQIASRTTVPVSTTPPASRRAPRPGDVEVADVPRRDVEVERRDVDRPRRELALARHDVAPAVRESEPAHTAPPEPTGSYTVLVATLSDAGMAEHLRSR